MDQVVEQSLIDKARAGDAASFTALLEQHYDLIYRVAWKACGNVSDAEDVAQEVCIKLGTSLSNFEGRSKFSSWLYRITLNAARDFLRKKKDHAPLDGIKDTADGNVPTDEQLEMKQLWSLVRKLPERQSSAVLLVYGEGRSHAEAGKILECKEGTISWALSEARKTLGDWLQSDG